MTPHESQEQETGTSVMEVRAGRPPGVCPLAGKEAKGTFLGAGNALCLDWADWVAGCTCIALSSPPLPCSWTGYRHP